MLTAAEKADGWKLMFDGKSLAGWRGYKTEKAPAGWRAFDGDLVRLGGGGDLMTVEQYGDFEMRFEWKITRVRQQRRDLSHRHDRAVSLAHRPRVSGPRQRGIIPTARTRLRPSGSNYAVNQPVKDVTKPVGQWNEGRIIVKGNHVEHWLNGVKVVEYEFGSADWQKRVQASKFGKIPPYGTVKRGYIALQDHESRRQLSQPEDQAA